MTSPSRAGRSATPTTPRGRRLSGLEDMLEPRAADLLPTLRPRLHARTSTWPVRSWANRRGLRHEHRPAGTDGEMYDDGRRDGAARKVACGRWSCGCCAAARRPGNDGRDRPDEGACRALLETLLGPGDELRLAGGDAPQPLGQPYTARPCRHRRRRQGGDRPVVERYGVPAQGLKILLAQPDGGRPEYPLVGLLWKPWSARRRTGC